MKPQEGIPKPIIPEELLKSIGQNAFSDTPSEEKLVTDFDKEEKRRPIFIPTKQTSETELFVGGMEPIKKPLKKEQELEEIGENKKINNPPKDTTPKSEKLKSFAEEVKKSDDPLALIGLKIKPEKSEPKVLETKKQKLSFLDTLLAGLRRERTEKKESISLEELRAKRLEQEIKAAVAEGNSILDAQEKELSESDRKLAESALSSYRRQEHKRILKERNPEEEYAGISGEEQPY